MKKIIAITLFSILLLSACTTTGVQQGIRVNGNWIPTWTGELDANGYSIIPHGKWGSYSSGQFAADRNNGSIMFEPEPENRIPDYKLRMYPTCTHWEKQCEWHCKDYEW